MDIIYVPILLLFYLLFIFEFGVVTKTYLILVWTSGRRKYQGEVYPLKDQLMWLVWCRIIQDKTNYLQIMIELWSSSPALKGNFIQTLILSFLIKSNKLFTKNIICNFCLCASHRLDEGGYTFKVAWAWLDQFWYNFNQI